MGGASKIIDLYPEEPEVEPEISLFEQALAAARERDNSPEAVERHALRAELTELITHLGTHSNPDGQTLTDARELLAVLDANPYLGPTARTELDIKIGRHLPTEYDAMHQGLWSVIRSQVTQLQTLTAAIQAA